MVMCKHDLTHMEPRVIITVFCDVTGTRFEELRPAEVCTYCGRLIDD